MLRPPPGTLVAPDREPRKPVAVRCSVGETFGNRTGGSRRQKWMAVIEKPRARAWAVFGLLVAVTTAGCGVGDGKADGPARPSADPTSVAAMLRLTPDTPANREQIWVMLWSKAEAAVDLDIDPDLVGDEREVRRLFLLGNDQETGTAMEGSDVVAPMDPDSFGSLGFLPSDVDASVNAGLPPNQFDVLVGDIDAADALDRAAQVDEATRTKVSGTEVVRWFDDYEMADDIGANTPFGRLPVSGRVTAEDGVLATDRSDAGIAAYIDAVNGDQPTLDEVEELAAVAEALDQADVHAAYLSMEMRGQGGVLAPHTALGVGNSLVDGHTEAIIVVQHQSDDDAKASERGLSDRFEGPRSQDGVAGSDLVSDVEVTREGTLTIARFTTDDPSVWSQLVWRADPLVSPS